MKSISFPPVRSLSRTGGKSNISLSLVVQIGTGQLDLDPTFVCQTMIDAAMSKLFNAQLDVFFVIYQSNDCFQVRQSPPFRVPIDSMRMIFQGFPDVSGQLYRWSAEEKGVQEEKFIDRTNLRRSGLPPQSNSSHFHFRLGKLLYTLSSRAQTNESQRTLIKSLENLYAEETLDLQSIDRRFSENVSLSLRKTRFQWLFRSTS